MNAFEPLVTPEELRCLLAWPLPGQPPQAAHEYANGLPVHPPALALPLPACPAQALSA